MLVRSQRVELLLRIFRVSQCLLCFAAEFFATLEFGNTFVLSQVFEILGISQQDLSKKLAVDKQFDEDFDGSRIICQKLQRRCRVRN